MVPFHVGMRVVGAIVGPPATEGTVVEVGEVGHGNKYTARVHWDGDPKMHRTSSYANYWQCHLRPVPTDPDAPD